MTAEQAMAALGVRPQTLYAYVSRGRIAAKPVRGDTRRSLYRAADIAGLTARKARGRKVAEVAHGAIAWGEPVLDSAISTTTGGRLWYRGQDALALAEHEPFEAVARLLWEAPPSSEPFLSISTGAAGSRAAMFRSLADRAASDAPALGRSPKALREEAALVMACVAGAAVGRSGPGLLHERFAAAWDCGEAGADRIRRALVLLADHELNPSTFAARVAASTGASPAASALAGLATLSGPRHGGMAADVHGLAAEAEQMGAVAAVAARLDQDREIPGFGHPLYPDGDPRARALLAAFEPPPAWRDLRAAAEAATGRRANIDFALAAMARTLGAPQDAPFILFAVARTAGWLAHALEQARSGALIRPRARYTGPAPSEPEIELGEEIVLGGQHD